MTMTTLTPAMLGGRTYDGVTVEQIGDDGQHYVALGHIDPTAFADAAYQHCRWLVGEHFDPDFDGGPFDPEEVEHRWAVLTDASDWTGPDEWRMSWDDVDETTLGAFPVTSLTISL